MLLTVYVTLHAQTNSVSHWDGSRLFVIIHAAPRENAANFAVIELLAKTFRVPKTSIILKRGGKSREKQFEIPLPEQTTLAILGTYKRN